MKKRWFAWMLVVSMVLTGCETLPKKFIRKKKQPTRQASAIFIEEDGGEKQFSNEYYYKTHFTFWKSWHDDMIQNLSGNSKKLRRASDEACSHLDQMANYLKAGKQAELKSLAGELAVYRSKISASNYSRSDAGMMRTELEKIRRRIAADFYYDKVKDEVLEDQVDLGESQGGA